MGLFDRFLKRKSLTLLEVVELTSVEIFANAVSIVRGLIDSKSFVDVLGANPDRFNKAAWEIVMEIVVLSLHLADRIAFNTVGQDQRSKFVDELGISVISNLSASLLRVDSPDMRSRFAESVLELDDTRSQTLAHCSSLAPEHGAPLEGTLFYETAKLVATEHFAVTEDFLTTMHLCAAFAQSLNGGRNLQPRLAAVRDF